MWHRFARLVRGPGRARASVWLTCALLAVLMQSIGLTHRIQHGEPLYASLRSSTAERAPGSDEAVNRLHPAHSCVLFDGDTVFTGGPSLPPTLPPAQHTPVATARSAHLPVDVPLVQGFRSRAPPAGLLPA